jgi:tetratricopeptide (TPR) repeat protein
VSEIPKVNRWIINPYSDALFFIATPVLSLCALLVANQYYSSEKIALFVLAFFAVGHHLPGLMRAYGETDLFARYKIRFIVSPVVIASFVGWSVYNGHLGFFILLAVWDMWHFFMQHYGFMRIYDLKRHKPSRLGSRLDWWVTATWFAYIIADSPHYLINFLERCHRYGFGFYTWIDPLEFVVVRDLIFYAALLVSVIYFFNVIVEYRRGVPIVIPKLAISITTFATVYIAYIVLEDVILGYAITALAHDVQYFAIVWIYNNGVLKRSKLAGKKFFRFLFQDGRLRLVGFYILLILGYGGIEATARATQNFVVYDIVKVIIATSAFLHYYYDGFIWKLRKPEISRNLVENQEPNVDAQIPRVTSNFFDWVIRMRDKYIGRSYFFETSKQIVCFGVPILFLAWTDETYSVTDVSAKKYLSQMAPTVAKTHDDLGIAYNREGNLQASIRSHQEAIRADSNYAIAYTHLGIAYSKLGDRGRAIMYHKTAIQIKPDLPQAHYNLGAEYLRGKQFEQAIVYLIKAVELDEEYVLAHKVLAQLYLRTGDITKANYHNLKAGRILGAKLTERETMSAMPWATGTPVE